MANMEVDLFKDFYNDKTVLITGHTGFKGSWLALWLKELGANVIGYGLDPYSKDDNFVLSKLEDKVIDIRGDIRADKLGNVFEKYKPEIVFHLAAQPLVRESYINPRETYDVNVMGTLNVLECIRNNKTRVGIMITTDKCYENKEQIWGYREDDPMGGYDPYSSSKGCCEILISSYRNSFFNLEDYDNHNIAIASVRAGNVIGGGDWSKDRIIPDSIRALRKGEKISIRNPKSIRPWQHVLEPLYGYMLLAKNLYSYPKEYSSGWNFGPNNELQISVSEVVSLLIKYWGEGSSIDISNNRDLHEANLLTLDCTKARKVLGWNPVFSFKDTVKFTAEWYKNIDKLNIYDLDVKQISEYCKIRKEGEQCEEGKYNNASL